jgi:hypothetical protein
MTTEQTLPLNSTRSVSAELHVFNIKNEIHDLVRRNSVPPETSLISVVLLLQGPSLDDHDIRKLMSQPLSVLSAHSISLTGN